MQGTRELIVGPGDAGPTGPTRVVVLAVPAGGTHINLTEPRFAMLKVAADNVVPVRITAEGANVYYHWSSVGTGLAADPTMTVLGPTGANQSAVVFAGQAPMHPEFPPQGANGLCVSAPLGGGTAMLRISRTG